MARKRKVGVGGAKQTKIETIMEEEDNSFSVDND
jgi:hypothetical protein